MVLLSKGAYRFQAIAETPLALIGVNIVDFQRLKRTDRTQKSNRVFDYLRERCFW